VPDNSDVTLPEAKADTLTEPAMGQNAIPQDGVEGGRAHVTTP
jgi:hypothetical protein